jgi:phosphatidylinositol alpha-1,6-mannosyltransferase
VVLVTSGFGPHLGGVGVVSAAIAAALAGDANVAVWRHRPEWARWTRQLALVLRASAASLHTPDFIVFTHVDLARAMLVMPFLRNVPYAVLIYGVEVWNPLDRWRRAVLERAAAVLAVSNHTVQKAREANPWLPDAKVIWLGTVERSGPLRRRTEPIVLILGRMASTERYKGHDALIDSWPLVLSAVPAARMVIVGTGDDRHRLEARVAGIASITFTGFLPDEARDSLLLSCSILVSISTGEGFGLAGIEAAAAGVPVVGLKGTVTEELFPDGCGHILLDSVDPTALADVLTRLLTDPDLSHDIGEAGRRRVKAVFTIGHFNRRIQEALRPFLNKPR